MDERIPCVCSPIASDPRHPQGDVVTFRDTLDFLTATSIRKSLAFIKSDDHEARAIEVLARLSVAYLMFGVEKWTIVDEKGKPVPVTHSAIRQYLLSNDVIAAKMVDAADALYQGVVLLPLAIEAWTFSPPTPTDESTSAPKGSSRKRRKPSSPSSTTTTPMDGIEMTSQSLDGDFSSSQSLT